MRRNFTMPANALDKGKLMLKVHHDEDCKIYINGVLALELSGYTGDYAFYDITSAAASALVMGGENTLAVHCHQTNGGQYIDVGISVMDDGTNTATRDIKKKALKVYPNPAKDFLRIDSENQEIEITGIYNVLGTLVKSPGKFDGEVDVSDLTSGMYFIRIKSDDKNDTVAFIKE
jgi:hypothetical protein